MRKDYYKANKDKVNTYQKNYFKDKYKTDVNFKINDNLSSAIRSSLKGKKMADTGRILVGYQLTDFMIHIENQFQPGMSWDNHGEWHIDHIKPKSLFNFKSYEDQEFKECWALDNLQPLWAKDNISKSNKLNTKWNKGVK